MKKQRKLNRRQIVFMMALAMAVMLLCAGGVKQMARASDESIAEGSHVLTLYDTRYDDGMLRVGYFEIDGNTSAMCVCHELEPPTQVGTALSTVASYTEDNRGNELLRKVYYYGWKGPGDVGASYVETCLAGSVANGHDDNYYGYGQAFIDRIAGLPNAPRGFNVYLLSDGVNTTQNLAYWEYYPTGFVALKKGTARTELVENNTCYSLQGAEYGIYTDADCRNQAAALTSDASGETGAAELEPGTYYIKETKAPEGYRLDETVYPVTVTAQETQIVEVEDMPVWDTLGLAVYKQDAEGQEGYPLGGASLEGANFEVCFYAGYYTAEDLPKEPDRTWLLEAKAEEVDGQTQYHCRLDREHLIEGDAFYEDEEQIVLPLGTVTVEERKAPSGYLLDGNYFQNHTGNVWEGRLLTQIRQNGNLAEMESGNVYAASDYVIRGDLELVKIADGTHKRLSQIPFRITSNTTGESHIILTDENGQVSTAAEWNLHSANTNLGETCRDGVWFGIKSDGTAVKTDDRRGALPFDTYTIEELRCENNQEYELIPPFTVMIRKDKTTVHLGTMTNDEIQEEKPENPKEPKQPVENPKPATVKTGDERNIVIPLITCILSCVAVVTCVMIARRMKKR